MTKSDEQIAHTAACYIDADSLVAVARWRQGGMNEILSHVLNKLYFKEQPKTAVGLETVKENVYRIMRSTVELRRGDSCLLVGPRNSGKTLVIEQSLEELDKEFNDQYIVVELSGFAHSDEKMAIREIARQLDIHTEGEPEKNWESIEKVSLNKTLKSLIDLFDRAEEESYAAGAKKKSVIFIVDEMDKFMASSRQSLLYNLLDLCQTSTQGVGLIGVSPRINVIESLEKRIRSRFSHLTFYTTRAKSLEEFCDIAYGLLCADDQLEKSDEWNNRMRELVAGPLLPLIEQIYYTTKDPRVFGSQVAPLVLQNYDAITKGTSADWSPNPLNCPSTTEQLVYELCELDWGLLICACRAIVRYNTEATNLALTQEEYDRMVSELSYERSKGHSYSGYRTWSSKAIKLGWERLLSLNLLNPVPSSADNAEDIKMVKPDTNLNELRSLVPSYHPLYSWTRL